MMIKNSINWLLEGLGQFVSNGIGYTATQLEPVFIIVAMAGVFLILFGAKRWGTKLTSFSIIIYTLTRIMS
jgi:uncharacterized membrane protein YuzA (DUF378 family)